MARPGLTLLLWLAIVLFVLLNDLVGDIVIAQRLPVSVVEWYKSVVPLPYVALLALIHARRTAGPRWLESAVLAAMLWPASTVMVDFLYARVTYDADIPIFLDRFAGPYLLLMLGLAALPFLMGMLAGRPRRPS